MDSEVQELGFAPRLSDGRPWLCLGALTAAVPCRRQTEEVSSCRRAGDSGGRPRQPFQKGKGLAHWAGLVGKGKGVFVKNPLSFFVHVYNAELLFTSKYKKQPTLETPKLSCISLFLRDVGKVGDWTRCSWVLRRGL